MNGGASITPRNRLVLDFFSHAALMPMNCAASASVMVDVNRLTTPANMRWKLIDRQTGKEGGAIDWRFAVGDQIKIRIVNEMDSDHPMHHPFHIHGAGRFLVLARNGHEDANLVWKDTVLVRTGETVDIVLSVTHPGSWMAHCHIAEHHESGMMLHFHVDQETSPEDRS